MQTANELKSQLLRKGFTPGGIAFVLRLLADEHEAGAARRLELLDGADVAEHIPIG